MFYFKAPRRGHVQLVAVKAGRRKTTLFDEVISEGEPDRVSEMGYDSRGTYFQC